jgi:hypothetical protein
VQTTGKQKGKEEENEKEQVALGYLLPLPNELLGGEP